MASCPQRVTYIVHGDQGVTVLAPEVLSSVRCTAPGPLLPQVEYKRCQAVTVLAGGPARVGDGMEDEQAKRQRQPTAPDAAPSAPSPPEAWPSASTLYAKGLENRAEAATTSPSWAINGQEWRASGFEAADADGATLKQRQQEARRAMLRR